MHRCTNRVVALTIALTASGAATAPANAAVLAEWTYETSQPASNGPHTAEGGLFAATSRNTLTATGTVTTQIGNGTPSSLRSTGWSNGIGTKYLQFQTSSLGFQDISLTFDIGASNTAPGDWKIQSSNDGTTFTDTGDLFVAPAPVAGGTNAWSASTYRSMYTFVFDLSDVPSLDNQASIYLRLVVNSNISANNGGANASSGGYIQIDDVLIEGDVVPEPAGVAALGVFAFALLCKRR